MSLPGYYSSLAPFEGIFRTGLPVLTYHHVGWRKRGARLKGLYLSGKLFARQMGELKEAGFETVELGTKPEGNGRREIVLTFDDGFCDVFENGLPILREHRFCGIQFLVSDLIGKTNEWQQRAGDVSEPLMDDAQVQEWIATGQRIGSHTRTHPRLTRISRGEAREEIFSSKRALEDRFGLAIEHFCYPYGDCNEAVRDLVIEAGYKTACTTKAGVNRDGDSRFEMKRFTARYRTRNLRAVIAWLGLAKVQRSKPQAQSPKT